MNKEKNIEIFNDTKDIVEKLDLPTKSTTSKHTLKEIVNNVTQGSKKGKIFVIPNDTITTAMSHGSGKICVLNMASPKTAGGGVARGSVAQEECLFRCTNLYQTVTQNFYPLAPTEALYTKNAVIVKDKNYVPISEPFDIDCITIAAVNLNSTPRTSGYSSMMKNKIRLMLSIPYLNGCDTIVLGAWGCGVFDNDPNDVAQMFYEILVDENMGIMFDNVIFGVINDNNSVGNNFQIFNDKLNLWKP